MRDTAHPKIRFLVLNLRMGGQVSSILSLRAALLERGIDAELLLPANARSASKHDLTEYATLPAPRRAAGLWALIRGLRALASDPSIILHLVVPSPAFLPILHFVPFPPERVIVQCEGPCTELDREHMRALLEDPPFIFPRIILNNRVWMRAGGASGCTHIASHPYIATQLREGGHEKVFEIANSGFLLPDADGTEQGPDAVDHQLLPLEDDKVWCAYVGHAHAVKGVDDLLAAFADAASRRPELRLLMALSGDGDAARVRRSIASSQLNDLVRLVGLVPVPELLDRIDVLVLPYRSTITTTLYPSLLLEADLARCPVLVAALPELMPVLDTHSDNVRVFPPRSVGSLADALATTAPRRGRSSRPFLRLPTAGERIERTISAYCETIAMARIASPTHP